MNVIRKYNIDIIIFLIALFLRLVIFGMVAHNRDYNYESFTADGYYEVAVSMVKYHVSPNLAILASTPNSLRTPGLPIIIVPFIYFFNSVFGFIILQIIISSLIPVISRRLALAVNLPVIFSNLIGFFMAVDVLGISLSMPIITETFFTFFLLLAVFYLVKLLRIISLGRKFFTENRPYGLVALCGFLLGVATLMRPTLIYFPLLMAMVWIIYSYKAKIKEFLKYTLVFLLASYLILTPWFYRNYKVFHVVGYSSIKEQVLYSTLVPSILAIKNHQSYNQAQKEFFLAQGFNKSPDVNLDEAAWFKRQAIKVIYNNPVYFLESATISLYTFFTHDGALNLLSQLKLDNGYLNYPHGLSFFKQSFHGLIISLADLAGSPLALVLLFRLFWILTAVCFMMSLVYQAVKKGFNIYSGFFLVLILYFALTTIANGLGVNARFRYPVNALILIFVIQGWQAWLNEYRSKKLSVLECS
ncbi:MAG: hypothetical protein UU95_C0007G0015 [Parcubacteria group bacterium GW2011_GWC2_42_12]|nr:MAG: hypothetical protein UU95_C0007G0015 [Parcubacteria group bacterium GW2011_GWC2_42_12]